MYYKHDEWSEWKNLLVDEEGSPSAEASANVEWRKQKKRTCRQCIIITSK